MKITSLEKMESIVDTNKTLSWEGWNVIELIRSNNAWSNPNAAFVKGNWYYKNVFMLTEDGWSIPNKYAR